MTNTIEQAMDYARTHPTRDGGTWHNWCESFIWRAGGFAGSFDDAWLAAKASGPLNLNHAAAPAGSIHYYSNSGRSPGHVAFGLGNDQLLMASNGVTTSFGNAIGTASWAEYHRNKPDMTYAGWTMRHGVQTLAASSAVAGTTTAITENKDNDNMARILNLRQTNDGTHNTDTIFLDGGPSIGIKPIATIDHLNLLKRYIADASGDHMFPAELALINAYLVPTAPTLDPSVIRAAVVSAIAGLPLGAAPTADAVAKAVDAVLADNFASIPKAVNDNAAARMKD